MARTYQSARISCGSTKMKTKVEWVGFAPTDAAGNVVEPHIPSNPATYRRNDYDQSKHSYVLQHAYVDTHPLILERNWDYKKIKTNKFNW